MNYKHTYMQCCMHALNIHAVLHACLNIHVFKWSYVFKWWHLCIQVMAFMYSSDDLYVFKWWHLCIQMMICMYSSDDTQFVRHATQWLHKDTYPSISILIFLRRPETSLSSKQLTSPKLISPGKPGFFIISRILSFIMIRRWSNSSCDNLYGNNTSCKQCH